VIRFNSDTIQETMNHIKMHKTHPKEAERKLDTIQNTLNRIKQLEKSNFHSKEEHTYAKSLSSMLRRPFPVCH